MPGIFSRIGILIYSIAFYGLFYSLDVQYSIHRLIYAISFAALLNFLRVIDLRFALPELIGLVTILMYTTAPALMFDLDSQTFMNSAIFGYDILAVAPKLYYSFAIPSVVIFNVVITYFFKKYRTRNYVVFVFEKITERYDIVKMIVLFSVISFFSSLLLGLAPALNQVFSMGAKLLTLVLILTLLLPSGKLKKTVFAFVVVLMVINTLGSGMFSELVFSLLFYALFRVLINGLSVNLKIILPFIGLIGLILLQVFKGDFREEAWDEQGNDDGFVIAADVLLDIQQNFSSDYVLFSTTLTLKRLNQAYLSSRVLEFVPSSEGYANGETILTTLYSLIPRIVWPDKPELSGRQLLEKYGNYIPYGNTSMSIGQLGESYANFGNIGGVVFFAVYGLFIAFTVSFLARRSTQGKPFLLFVPIVMYHMTKPEVIFSKAFNTAFKGVLFIFIMLFLINKFCLKDYDETKTL